jgi:hypothetical protein
MDWCSAFPAVPLSDALRRLALLLDALRAAHQALQAAGPAAGAAGGRGGGGSGAAGAGGAGGGGEEAPEEFMDPITMSLMSDPVKLPDSGVTLDRWVREGVGAGGIHEGPIGSPQQAGRGAVSVTDDCHCDVSSVAMGFQTYCLRDALEMCSRCAAADLGAGQRQLGGVLQGPVYLVTLTSPTSAHACMHAAGHCT